MNPVNSGSFAAPIGGADIINAAMASRGAQGSPFAQVSPSSPIFDPSQVPPGPTQPQNAMPMGAPNPMQGQAPQPQPQPPELFDNPQEKIIVQALIKQLERLGKTKEMALGGGGAGILY